MSEPFIGEIRMFGGNFAPVGWALCNGQLMSISQNTALFSLLGTIYGGDGRTTFGVPDLRGRVSMGADTQFTIAQKGGVETVTLNEAQTPQHHHWLKASKKGAKKTQPADNVLAKTAKVHTIYTTNAQTTLPLSRQALSEEGGGQAHDNMQPFVCFNFIIALQGTFPQRS